MADKGNYYKLKSKPWLQERGYHVDYLERYVRIRNKDGKLILIRHDIVGADGLATSDTEFILWNSILGRDHINRAIEKFLKYPCPPFVKRWVLVWEKGDREPEIIDVAEVKDE